MTHSGGKPHTNVGDKGQQYEVRFFDSEENRRRVFGWSDDYEVAEKMAKSLVKRPGWSKANIVDRGRNYQPVVITPDIGE